jgi:hypothetical protein
MVDEIASETKLLRCRSMGENLLAMDECEIEWDGESVCNLSDFINSYFDIFIDKMCNVLDSFTGEDISCYFYVARDYGDEEQQESVDTNKL